MNVKYKPNFTKLKHIVYLIVWTAFVVFVTSFIWAVKTDPNNQSVSATDTKELIVYINELRLSKGLSPLKPDSGLADSARLKAEDMDTRNYWAHTAPDGEAFYVLPEKIRPGLKKYGENLAECFGSNKATFDGWVTSPGHYKNMVDPDYDLYGSATVYDKDRNCLITVNHFGQD